jgi:hypothetical protein
MKGKAVDQSQHEENEAPGGGHYYLKMPGVRVSFVGDLMFHPSVASRFYLNTLNIKPIPSRVSSQWKIVFLERIV